MRKIDFYKTESGRSPVEEYFDSLSGKEFQKLDWVLRVISEVRVVPREYFQKMSGTDDIWEVRAQFASRAMRVLGFFAKPEILLLTNGFNKKTAKTPPTEIELAEARKKDYLKRSN